MDSPDRSTVGSSPRFGLIKLEWDLSLRTRISGLTLFQKVGGVKIVNVISNYLDRH